MISNFQIAGKDSGKKSCLPALKSFSSNRTSSSKKGTKIIFLQCYLLESHLQIISICETLILRWEFKKEKSNILKLDSNYWFLAIFLVRVLVQESGFSIFYLNLFLFLVEFLVVVVISCVLFSFSSINSPLWTFTT